MMRMMNRIGDLLRSVLYPSLRLEAVPSHYETFLSDDRPLPPPAWRTPSVLGL
jgi:hypothetical protein